MIEYIKRNWKWAILIFFIYLSVYGLAIFRFGKTVEDCSHFLVPGSEFVWSYFAASRWTLAVWRWVFGGGIPFASGLVAGLILSICVLLQTYLFKIKDKRGMLMYVIFYFCCMQWLFVLRFAMLSDVMAFGLLCATLSVIFLQGDAPRFKTACVLLAISLGTYQTCVFYFIALWLGAELANADNNEGSSALRRLCAGVGTFLGGVIIWFVLHKFFVLVSGCPQRWLDAANTYNANQTNWPQLLDCDFSVLPRAAAHHILDEGVLFTLSCLAGAKHIGQWVYGTALIPLIVLIVGFWKHMPRKKALYLSLYAVSLIYVPFSVALVLLWGWAAPRVMVAEPLAVAALWGLAFPLVTSRFIKCVCSCLAGFVALKGIYYGACFAHDEAYYWNSAMQELRDMEERGRQLAAANNMENAPIIVLGDTPDPAFSNGVGTRMKDCGYWRDRSLPVSWNMGHDVFAGYVQYMRLNRLRLGTPSDREKHQEAYDSMPAWPKDGCMRIDRGEVILKVQ